MKTLWKDTYYVKAYQLAKSGFTNTKVAAGLGVTLTTLEKWISKKAALREALTDARSVDEAGAAASFRDYVYQRLDPHLRDLWDTINRFEKEKNGILRIEALLEAKGKRTRQRLWLYALTNSNFNPSAACRKVNISRQTFEAWCGDPDFQSLVDEIDWHKGNFFEAQLVRLVKSGDTHATIFANRTFNRDRGYNDKLEVEGKIQHEHSYTLDDLDLPADQLRSILDAITKKEQGLLEHKDDKDTIDAEFTVKGSKPKKAGRRRK